MAGKCPKPLAGWIHPRQRQPKNSLLALFQLQGSPTNLGQARQSALMGPKFSLIKSEFKSACKMPGPDSIVRMGRDEEQRKVLVSGCGCQKCRPHGHVWLPSRWHRGGQDFPQRAPQMVFVCSATIKKENIWCNLLADRDRHMVGVRRAWVLGKTQSRLCSGF